MTHSFFKNFFFPKVTRTFFIRVGLVAAIAFVTFRFIVVPAKIQGKSMEPTYHDGSFILYLPWMRYLKEPEINDIVLVRLAGNRVMLIKRIVALPGDTVEWKDGALIRNGNSVNEPYVDFNENWTLDKVEVPENNVYVVGDNRGMPLENHDFGYTTQKRIAGYPLW